MFKLPLKNNEALIVSSNWDSGVHCSFNAGVIGDGDYSSKSLDKVLSKTQIQQIELLIATHIHEMLSPEMWKKNETAFEQFDRDTDNMLKTGLCKLAEELENKK